MNTVRLEEELEANLPEVSLVSVDPFALEEHEDEETGEVFTVPTKSPHQGMIGLTFEGPKIDGQRVHFVLPTTEEMADTLPVATLVSCIKDALMHVKEQRAN